MKKKEKWMEKVEIKTRPLPKELFTLRLDKDIISWLRTHENYNALIGGVLRAYMNAHKGEK